MRKEYKNINYNKYIMFRIAVIKPNTKPFENLSIADMKTDKLENLLKSYIDIVNIPKTEELMFNSIIENMDLHNEGETCRTYKCYETPDSNFFIMYNDKEPDEEHTNMIGRFLSERHEPIYGRCILIQTTLREKCDITFDNIIKIIKERFIHKAVLISSDDIIQDIEFTQYPFENTHLTNENSRCIPIDFMTKQVCMFMELHPEQERLNKMATIMAKKMKIHGDVIVSMLTSSTEIMDIDKILFCKMLIARSNVPNSVLNEVSEDVRQNNFYDILERLLNKFGKELNENIPEDVLISQSYNSTLIQ